MPKHQRSGMILSWIYCVLCFMPAPSVLAFTTSPLKSPLDNSLVSHFYHDTSSFRYSTRRTRRLVLSTEDSDTHHPSKMNPFTRAAAKFKSRPGTYLLIPCVAAAVGWVTNWMAVQMIFYPVRYWGIPLLRKPEVPLGLIGWQGIVPCKTRPMSEAMVKMVTEQLLSVKEVFSKLNPSKCASLLAPEVPKMAADILNELPLPGALTSLPGAVYGGLSPVSQSILQVWNRDFLRGLVVAMQTNIESIFSVRNCVVEQMLQDRTLLGQLFMKCGQKELDFLTNSGLWFGFLLGVIQMIVALFWENPWSLSIGGAIVGLATNWLALKWIFEPVNPTKVGPFILQGQFLRRQKEVAKEFSAFFANKILNSKELWTSMLTDPVTSPAFATLFAQHFKSFLNKVSFGLLRYKPEPETIALATRKALEKLPNHVGVLHEYVDKTLGLQETLRVRMEQMTSVQFERVLHPIFEEDELTLILAGAFLGFAAGLVQQGLETGQIQLPEWGALWTKCKGRCSSMSKRVTTVFKCAWNRIRPTNPHPPNEPPSSDALDSTSDTDEGM